MSRGRPHLGIGARIAGGSFVIALLICVLAGLLVDLRVQQILRSSSEAVLAGVAAPYAQSVRDEPGEDLDAPGPSQQIAVIDPAGTTHVDTLPTALSEQVRSRTVPADTEVIELGSPEQIVRIQPVAGEGGTWRVVSAVPRSDEAASLTRMRWLLVAVLAVVPIGVCAGALLLTTASLGPVRRIRRTADQDLPAVREDIAGAERSAERLTELVGSLLELSRIEAADPARADGAELTAEVHEAVDRAGFRAGQQVDLTAHVRPLPAGALYPLSAADLGRVLDNLLTNALRAVGEEGRVEVTLHGTERGLALTVADSGGGMSEDFAPRALDRFSQADPSRPGGGAGLGLPIVAAVVARAGGTLDLDNRPGEGLTVRLTLPTG
ncbi:sensor histidine kinase [Brachybacterium squillarum]|uniref:sensor histidine kinase n=1 Tax=Brachybacterium squillarum TaxID=661979 RepID=UPI0022225D9F|nr:HAMP domain-containing sensor histidine kinase [Brachybacterium squillarum]MCW1806418.1 HAMP domain-containing histidine kinase [Brachybacterium squillarum]